MLLLRFFSFLVYRLSCDWSSTAAHRAAVLFVLHQCGYIYKNMYDKTMDASHSRDKRKTYRKLILCIRLRRPDLKLIAKLICNQSNINTYGLAAAAVAVAVVGSCLNHGQGGSIELNAQQRSRCTRAARLLHPLKMASLLLERDQDEY